MCFGRVPSVVVVWEDRRDRGLGSSYQWRDHMVKYYSAIKRNDVLTHTTMWMNLEDTLSEISQTQRDK